MKSHNLIFILLLGLGSVYAQSIEREVINASGNTSTNTVVSLDFSIGELAVTDISDGTNNLNQGFHQPHLSLAIVLDPIVFLQGALLSPYTGEEHLMRDDLRSLYLPTTSPYIDAATCAASVFNAGGTSATGLMDDDIVDWIWVELRDALSNTTVVAGQSALLQRDGNVVAVDGLSHLEFEMPAGDYYVAVRHRNHLGIMTLNTAALSNTVTLLNFTDATNQITYGTRGQSDIGMPVDVVAMWAGNANGDTQVSYQGPNNDTNTIKDHVFAAQTGLPSNLYSYMAYDTADVNLDASVRYQGAGNDSNVIKDIILQHPDNAGNSNLFTIPEQLPEN